MPHYRFRAMTVGGEIVAGEIEAPTRDEVARRAEYLGHLLIDAELAAAVSLLSKNGRSTEKRSPKKRDVTIFFRQLALLIQAGLTLEAALQTLGEDTNKALVWFANNLRAPISTGESFAEALARHPTVVEPAHIAMVKAGEATGKLDAVLSAIVVDRSRQEALGEKLGSALRYPSFLIISALAILSFFLLFVVPQFEPVFKDLGGRLNSGAALVLAASTWLRADLQFVASGFLAIALGAWLVLRRRGARGRIAAVFGSVPGVSGPMRDRRTARVTSALGLMLENGVSLPATLKILRDVVSEPRHVADIDRIHEQVRGGRRFADAIGETELLPPLAVRMLRVGDEAGDLPSVAKHAAAFYEARFAAGLDRLMGIVGPAAIIAVSLLVGGLIVSIMSALLSITELAT